MESFECKTGGLTVVEHWRLKLRDNVEAVEARLETAPYLVWSAAPREHGPTVESARERDFESFYYIPFTLWGWQVWMFHSASEARRFIAVFQGVSWLTLPEFRRMVERAQSKAKPDLGLPGPVFPEWMFALPYQQQSVMLLAARGPDGVRKQHPCKGVVRAYRACVLKAARFGRLMRLGESRDDFMNLVAFENAGWWSIELDHYYSTLDELPHHYHLHLLHGAEVLAYKHPEQLFRERWLAFYERGVADAHLRPESKTQMDARLNDWGQKDWKP